MIDDPIKTKNQMLLDHACGKLSLTELTKECAYWYRLCFKTLRVKPLPTPPQKYQYFSNMTYTEKKEVPKEFWLLQEIKNYLDQKFEIINENKMVLYHLKDYIRYIPEGDFLALSDFNSKIVEFESELQGVGNENP